MASQTDLDQGGTYRKWDKVYLGPTIGWVYAPARNELRIILPGTYTLDLSTNYVELDTTGAVTINLPPTSRPTGRGAANARPGLQVSAAITITDIGGLASISTFLILPDPNTPSDLIMNLSQIQLNVNFGTYVLAPNPAEGQWVTIS